MKLKSFLGAALAGALALGSSLAYAQTGPIYITPKLLYSHQSINSFNSTTNGSIITSYSGGDKTDNVFGGGLAIGYDFGAVGYTPFRAELEFLARGASEASYGTRTSGVIPITGGTVASAHSLKVKAYTVFANVYYDFINDSDFTPYIGGGLGAAYLDTTSSVTMYHHVTPAGRSVDGNQDTVNFAWNLGGGVAYRISDTVALDFGYRYTDFGEAEASSRKHHYLYDTGTGEQFPYRPHTKADISAHEFILGLRISGY